MVLVGHLKHGRQQHLFDFLKLLQLALHILEVLFFCFSQLERLSQLLEHIALVSHNTLAAPRNVHQLRFVIF